MNTPAFWIILLGFWVFALQSRVKHLEKMLEGIKGKLDSSQVTKHRKPLNDAPIYNEENNVYVKPETLVVQESKSSIEAFKERYAEETSKHEVQKVSEPQKVSKPARKAHQTKKIEPTEPSWLMQMLTNYFTGGNLLVRIGGVILFFGLAFLVKYAAEHTTISMEFRLISIALVAVGLIVLGWKLREREGAYGQILQGLGVAVLYLVIYGASKFYALLPLDLAFVLMLVVVVLGSLLALKQSSLPLALFATTGGFLVPILTSTGTGSHVVLFSYYFVLNLGIFFMAWKQTWRVLNIVGFLFTFVIATIWGVLRYHPDLFGSTEPFLILSFLMYLAITILFAGKSKGHLVEGTLLFGLPAVVFPLQVELVSHIEYGAGYSAMAMGSLYLVLAKGLKAKTPSRLLLQSFFGLGILFYTTAIPYFFDADITAAIWAMESAAVIWLSLKQNRTFVRYFGELLLLVSVGLYLVSEMGNTLTFSIYLGYMIVTLATFFSAYQQERHKEQLTIDIFLPTAFFLLSFSVWMLSVWKVSVQFKPYMLEHKMLLGFTLGTMLVALADKLLNWQLLGKVLQATLPVGVVFFMLALKITPHPINPFVGLGGLAFFTLIVWHAVLLYRYDTLWGYAKYLHILSLWFTVAVLTIALRYTVTLSGASKEMIFLSLGILPLLSAFAVMKGNLSKIGLASYISEYRYIGVGGLLLFLLFWEGVVCFFGADTIRLPYMPVFNLLDISQLVVFYVMYIWIRYIKQEKVWGLPLFFMAVVLVTVVFARAVAHYQDVPYLLSTLWRNLYFQTGLSLLWSCIAIVLMLLSKRYAHRVLWLAGFGLLGIVVLKLFFVELASSGTIERIISFMVVGTLLLLIGYFVPLPPNDKVEGREEE